LENKLGVALSVPGAVMDIIQGYRRHSYRRSSASAKDSWCRWIQVTAPDVVTLKCVAGARVWWHIFRVQNSCSLCAAADVCATVVRFHRQRTPNLLQNTTSNIRPKKDDQKKTTTQNTTTQNTTNKTQPARAISWM